jgi:hypothetical protein
MHSLTYLCPTLSPVARSPAIYVVARSSDVSDAAQALLDGAAEWLRSILLWVTRAVTWTGELLGNVVRTVLQIGAATAASSTPGSHLASLGASSPGTSPVVTSLLARRADPADSASFPGASTGRRVEHGVIQQYAAPAPVRRLEEVAASLSSASTPTSPQQAQERVEAASQVLREFVWTDSSTAARAVAAVEAIGTSGLDPLGAIYETAATALETSGWPADSTTGAVAMLDFAVAEMTASLRQENLPRARMFAALLGAVASVRHRDAAARLLWFAEAVVAPAHEAGVDPAAVRTSLTRCVGRWFRQLRDSSTCDVIDVNLAYWQLEVDSCLHREAIDQWVTGARREQESRRAREQAAKPLQSDAVQPKAAPSRESASVPGPRGRPTVRRTPSQGTATSVLPGALRPFPTWSGRLIAWVDRCVTRQPSPSSDARIRGAAAAPR